MSDSPIESTKGLCEICKKYPAGFGRGACNCGRVGLSRGAEPEMIEALDELTEHAIATYREASVALDRCRCGDFHCTHWQRKQESLTALRDRIRTLEGEAKERGFILAKAEVAARLVESGATGSIRV